MSSSSFLLKLLGKFHWPFIRIREKKVNFLEGELRSLRVEEVHQWHESKVGAHEYQVCLPLQPVDDDGGDHDDEEVLCLGQPMIFR